MTFPPNISPSSTYSICSTIYLELVTNITAGHPLALPHLATFVSQWYCSSEDFLRILASKQLRNCVRPLGLVMGWTLHYFQERIAALHKGDSFSWGKFLDGTLNLHSWYLFFSPELNKGDWDSVFYVSTWLFTQPSVIYSDITVDIAVKVFCICN